MSKPSQLHSEQEHHKRAFEIYYALGERRSYRSVAQRLGVSPSGVKLWSQSFGWQQRVRDRDADTARQLADRSLSSGLSERDRNLKMVRGALLRLARGIHDGTVKMQMGDLDRLIRLEEHLVTPADDFMTRYNLTPELLADLARIMTNDDPEELMKNKLFICRRLMETDPDIFAGLCQEFHDSHPPPCASD